MALANLTRPDAIKPTSGQPTPYGDPKTPENTTPKGYIPLVYPAQPLSYTNERTTRPPYLTGYAGVLTIVPRRGWDQQTSLFLQDVATNPNQVIGRWAQSLPLRLLGVLADIHPMVSMARSIWLNLSFPTETSFVAMKEGKIDDQGTADIEALVEMLPPELGGANGLQRTIGEMVLFNGLPCVEAVPAPDASQLVNVLPFDPLTIRWRDDGTGERFLEQQQRTGWRQLNRELCFALPFDGSYDNPYGRALFSAALGEALTDIAGNQNLSDVLRVIAYPRLTVGFPWEEITQYAIDHPEVLIGRGTDSGDMDPGQYAMAEFQRLSVMVQTLKADDVFLYPNHGSVGMINGAAGMAGLAPVLELRRVRLCQGLNTLPTLLGVPSGGTLAYADTDWGVQIDQLKTFRNFVNGIMCRVFNLHLQLRGRKSKTVAKAPEIRAGDVLKEAEAHGVEIANQARLIDLGFTTRESASLKLIGRLPVRN